MSCHKQTAMYVRNEYQNRNFSFFFLCFFPHPIYFEVLYLPFCYLSLPVVTQIRGHIAGSSPPLPTTVCAWHSFITRYKLPQRRIFHFYREQISGLLPSSTRVEMSELKTIKIKLTPFRSKWYLVVTAVYLVVFT